MTQQPADNKAL